MSSAVAVSERSAGVLWRDVVTLLKLDSGPPPPYQGQFDPSAIWGALKTLT